MRQLFSPLRIFIFIVLSERFVSSYFSLSSLRKNVAFLNGNRDIFSLRKQPPNQPRPNIGEVSKASPLQQLSFGWVRDLLKIGSKRRLELYDIWEFDDIDKMSPSSAVFTQLLNEESKNTTKLALSSTKHNENILQLFWKSAITKAVFRMCVF